MAHLEQNLTEPLKVSVFAHVADGNGFRVSQLDGNDHTLKFRGGGYTDVTVFMSRERLSDLAAMLNAYLADQPQAEAA